MPHAPIKKPRLAAKIRQLWLDKSQQSPARPDQSICTKKGLATYIYQPFGHFDQLLRLGRDLLLLCVGER